MLPDCGSYLLHLFFLDEDVVVLFVLVTFDQFRPFHLPITHRTVQTLTDTRMALFVKLIETDAVTAGGDMQTDRYGDQAEAQVSFPNR